MGLVFKELQGLSLKVSVAVMKHDDAEQLGEERAHSAHASTAQFIS